MICYNKVRLYTKRHVKFVVKVNIMSSDLIGGYLTLDLNPPIKWADFRFDASLAHTMLTKLCTVR
jgi:hypothetical protein